MTQLGEPARLLKELLRLVLRHFGAASEHLDGDGPIELRVVAQIDRAISADAQGVPHLVAAESGRVAGTTLSVTGSVGGPSLSSPTRPVSLPESALVSSEVESAESDREATSVNGSSGSGSRVGCIAASSSRSGRLTVPITRAHARAIESDVAVGDPLAPDRRRRASGEPYPTRRGFQAGVNSVLPAKAKDYPRA